MMGKTAEFRGV
jgi:superfamily II DNA helicase RecQ